MRLFFLIQKHKSILAVKSSDNQAGHPENECLLSVYDHDFHWEQLSKEESSDQTCLRNHLIQYFEDLTTVFTDMPAAAAESICLATPFLLPVWTRQAIQQALYHVFSCWNIIVCPLPVLAPFRHEIHSRTLQYKLFVQSTPDGYYFSLISSLADGALCLETESSSSSIHLLQRYLSKYPVTEVLYFSLQPEEVQEKLIFRGRNDIKELGVQEILSNMENTLNGPAPAFIYPFSFVLEIQDNLSGRTEHIALPFDRHKLELRFNTRYRIHTICSPEANHVYRLFERDKTGAMIPTGLEWEQQISKGPVYIDFDLAAAVYTRSSENNELVNIGPENLSFPDGSTASFEWLKNQELSSENAETSVSETNIQGSDSYLDKQLEQIHFKLSTLKNWPHK